MTATAQLLTRQRELLRTRSRREAAPRSTRRATRCSALFASARARSRRRSRRSARSRPSAGRSDAEVRVRMGLHTGEAALGRDGYVGIAVHRGRRVCEAAHGGQILVSSATHAIIAADPPEGIGFREVGEVRLAGFEQPERLFQVVADGLAGGVRGAAGGAAVARRAAGSARTCGGAGRGRRGDRRRPKRRGEAGRDRGPGGNREDVAARRGARARGRVRA